MIDELKELEREQRSKDGSLLQSDAGVVELSSSGGKVVVKRDPEAEKAALFEAGSSGKTTTSRNLEGAARRLAAERAGQVPTVGPVVEGPDDREEFQKREPFVVEKKGFRPKKHVMRWVGLEADPNSNDHVLLDLWGRRGLVLKYLRNKNKGVEGDVLLFAWRSKRGKVERRFVSAATLLTMRESIKGGRAGEWGDRFTFDRPTEESADEFAEGIRLVSVHGQELGAGEIGLIEMSDKLIREVVGGKMEVIRITNKELREAEESKRILKLRSRVGKIRNKTMRRIAEEAMGYWGSNGDGSLRVRPYKNSQGEDRVYFDEVKGKPSLPLSIFLGFCLGGKWQGKELGYVSFGRLNVDGTTSLEELKKHLGIIELDGKLRRIAWVQGQKPEISKSRGGGEKEIGG